MMNKIAVLVDSGCDLPLEIAQKSGVYVLPLKIIYSDREYRDNIDISASEVYQNLDKEVPKTSLPSGEEIEQIFNQIKADGYEKLIAITISSALSGTHNMIKIIADDTENLEVLMVDTKNIAIGSGFSAILAKDLIDKGENFENVHKIVCDNIQNAKVMFSVATLEYLRKGGRIGLVSSLLGTKLNLKPIISCNDDGVYYTVAKVRGRQKCIEKMIELACEFAGENKYNICICNGGASDEIEQFTADINAKLDKAVKIYSIDISPTLGVHTGPSLLGVAVQIIK